MALRLPRRRQRLARRREHHGRLKTVHAARTQLDFRSAPAWYQLARSLESSPRSNSALMAVSSPDSRHAVAASAGDSSAKRKGNAASMLLALWWRKVDKSVRCG